MEVGVYLFVGFLESGKTKFIEETLADPNFYRNRKENTLVILCEEGEESLDNAKFASKNVFIEIIDSERRLNPDKLEAIRRKHNATTVLIEYNGMWLIRDLINALPDNWFVYQQVMLADSTNIEFYNANMRNLVVDKLSGSELVIFNRCDNADTMSLHKLVRGISRRTDIIYENTDGSFNYDDVEDPLPFDINAPLIKINDRDFALFYRDLGENMPSYDKKRVEFLGMTRKNDKLPKGGFIIGRPIMTCCADDIAFGGLFCENGEENAQDGGWMRITAEISIENCRVYGRKGPVLKLIGLEKAETPENPVATFY